MPHPCVLVPWHNRYGRLHVIWESDCSVVVDLLDVEGKQRDLEREEAGYRVTRTLPQ